MGDNAGAVKVWEEFSRLFPPDSPDVVQAKKWIVEVQAPVQSDAIELLKNETHVTCPEFAATGLIYPVWVMAGNGGKRHCDLLQLSLGASLFFDAVMSVGRPQPRLPDAAAQ